MEEFHGRRKAFLGSLLGAVGGIVGSIVPGIGTAIGAAAGSALGGIGDSLMQANQQDKAAARQQRAQIYSNRLKGAESLNQALSNTEYIDSFKDRFDFAFGGNIRPAKYDVHKPAVKFQNRLPKLKVGGSIR